MLNEVKLQNYTNIKTGNLYTVKGFALNATNGSKDQLMVIYQKLDAENDTPYVREIKEFKEKFN